MLILVGMHVAIARLKEEKIRCVGIQDPPPVAEEEFMPLKTNRGGNYGKGPLTMAKESCDMKNWMSSAQLWTTDTKLVIIPKSSFCFFT